MQDFLRKLIPYLNKLREKWHWIAISASIIGCLFLYQAVIELPTYTASTTFVLNKEFTLPNRLIGRTLSVRRKKRINKRQQRKYCEQVIAYATSRALMRQTLFRKVKMDGQVDFLANHIIESYGIFKKEKLTNPKLKPLINFKFQHAVIDSLSRNENKAFRRVSGLMKNKKRDLLTAIFDKNRHVLILSVTGPHPNLPAIILNAIYEDLATYYYNKEFGYLDQQQKILTAKLIEDNQKMKELIPPLVTEMNQSGNYLSKTEQLAEKNLKQSFEKLTASNDKMTKLLTQIDFTRLQVTPIFEVYQPPNAYPTPQYRSYSWWIATIMGISIGAVIGVLIIAVSTGIQNLVTLVKTTIQST